MTKMLIDRSTVEQALHVATAAGYPVALIAALRAALTEEDKANAIVRLEAEFKHNIRQTQDRIRDKMLAEPVQEPVAWMYSDDHKRMLKTETFCTVYSVKVGSPDKGVTDVPLFTAPPQRKPLTEEEIREMFFAELRALPSYPSAIEELPVRLARAIERAHKIGGEV